MVSLSCVTRGVIDTPVTLATGLSAGSQGRDPEAKVLRVEVRPEMLRWAWERAGFDLGALSRRIPQLPSWYREETHPTLK